MAGVPLPRYRAYRDEMAIDPDAELTYRSAMLPLGTYRNEDGTESPGFAWPGMITEPINALERLGSGGFSNPQDPAAQQDMTTLLLSLYGGNALNPLARVPKGSLASGAMRETKPKGITAYHGSPHEFDKFSTEHIGKGEGAQAYGSGLYFAESRDVADSYRTALSSRNVPSSSLKAPSDVLRRDAEKLGELFVSNSMLVKGVSGVDVKTRGDVLPVMRRLIKDREIAGAVVRLVPVDVMNVLRGEKLSTQTLLDNPTVLVDLLPIDANDAVSSRVAAMDELAPYVALAAAERPLIGAQGGGLLREALSARMASKGDLRHSGNIPYPNESGHLYQVRINAEPEDFLDWDKPLSQQSENVKSALKPLADSADVSVWPRLMLDESGYPSDVRYLYEDSAKKHGSLVGGSQAKISEFLAENGIPGIRYLDQGSRTAGDGSRNYVVFDDSLIDIMKKYGLLAGAVGAGELLSNGTPASASEQPSPYTGETIFSDTGRHSLMGSAISGDDKELQTTERLQTFADGGPVMDALPYLRLSPRPSDLAHDANSLDYLGFGPLSQRTVSGLSNREMSAYESPAERAGSAILEYGPIPARALVSQPGIAGEAISDAINDPSLPNVTNAGLQTGLAFMSPRVAIGSLGAGLGIAGAMDAGFDLVPEAVAGKKKPSATSAADLPGLTPEQNDDYKRTMGRITAADFQSGAERRTLESQANMYRQISQEFVSKTLGNEAQAKADKAKSEQDEFNRAVEFAEAVRDKELGRIRRFSDTSIGKVWDKTGGFAPMLAGIGFGAGSRLATGGGRALYDYGLPAIFGGTAGAAANNIPLAYNAFNTEPDNPEKAAYTAYARELPSTHPRRQEWMDYAAELPSANPVRAAASAELYDPVKAAERSLFGAIEGVGGGLFGADLIRIPGRIVEGTARIPGRASTAYVSEFPSPPAPKTVRPLIAEDVPASQPALSPTQSSIPELELSTSGTRRSARSPSTKATIRSSDRSKAKKEAKTESSSVSQNEKKKAGSSATSEQIAASNELKRFLKTEQEGFASGGQVLPRVKTSDEGIHVGPLHSGVSGRTDHLAITVPAGAYVVPADIVSALGEGNTSAGMEIVREMFPEPNPAQFASGGKVPIMAAGGEFVISPDQVAAVGNGNLDHGHKILDAFIKDVRADTIKTLKRLPGPAK